MNQNRADNPNEKQFYEKITDYLVVFIYLLIALLIAFPFITGCEYDLEDMLTRCPDLFFDTSIARSLLSIAPSLIMALTIVIPLYLLVFGKEWWQIKEKRYQQLGFSNLISKYPLDIFIYFIPKIVILMIFIVLFFLCCIVICYTLIYHGTLFK